MLVEQIEAIKTNASKIARMKMRVGQAGTELSRVTEEFNEMFGGDSNQVAIHWFIPIPIEFPNGMKKAVLGYEWDGTFDAVPYQEPNSADVESGGLNPSTGSKIELTTVLPASSNEGQNSRLENLDSEGGEDEKLCGSAIPALGSQSLVKRSSRDPLRPGGTLT